MYLASWEDLGFQPVGSFRWVTGFFPNPRKNPGTVQPSQNYNLTLNRWHAEKGNYTYKSTNHSFFFGFLPLHFRGASGQCVWVFTWGIGETQIVISWWPPFQGGGLTRNVYVCVHGRRCVVTILKECLSWYLYAWHWHLPKQNQASNVTKVSYWKSFIENLMHECTVSAPNIYTP